MLTIDGRRIEYQEAGEGPATLFVPGSFSTAAAWRGLQKHLPIGYRLISISLLGYGHTNETRTLSDYGMEHEVQVLRAVAEQIKAPVHLVGYSFGGTVALAAALAGAVDVRSLATFEANPLTLLRRQGHHELFQAMRQMSDGFEAACIASERDAASRVIDFWGREGAFSALPEQVQDYCRATAFSNVLDWRTAYAFEANQAQLAELDVPALVVRGGRANAAMIEISKILAESLPNARTAVVDGAGHFLISSHPKECARLLEEFWSRVQG